MVHVVDSVLAKHAVNHLLIDHGALHERRLGIHVVPKATAQIIQGNHLVAHANQVINHVGSHESTGSRDERDRHCSELLATRDRKSTRLNSSHSQISYAVFCLKKKKKNNKREKTN